MYLCVYLCLCLFSELVAVMCSVPGMPPTMTSLKCSSECHLLTASHVLDCANKMLQMHSHLKSSLDSIIWMLDYACKM